MGFQEAARFEHVVRRDGNYVGNQTGRRADCARSIRHVHATRPDISRALEGTDVLTVGATGVIVERGACVGFELEEGKPKIYVNLRVSKAQKVDFEARLLRLVKLV